MTQLHLHPYRPESGDARPLRKLARNYRAIYRQYQNSEDLKRDTAEGRWVAIESAMPGATAYDEVNWPEILTERYAEHGGLHFVTGSMNHGLPHDVLEMMDFQVYVPQFDDVPFLAPFTAAAIVLQEVFQRTANRAGVWG